ncbi:hypothetical protein GCM10011519_33420 [Marmoricola endophyticus]|uniref:Class I SAM-dependent methyltransferase n=1 Tax=Marmoricola endophyticus TaxID=2040280 RepID=A0A917FA39_9ACTN|nr:class I SAM-dependent methyltransferase [Marmoricola endophyticus]GGF56820.1 hypothetical protein GCM10011519_33420 [Marmoricola endophyticus]
MPDQTLLAPPLPPEKFRFLTEGLERVQGYLIGSTALYLSTLEYVQRGEVEGRVAEIGVHRGKSFIAMTVGLPEDQTALAIDIFDAQHLNMEATSVDALRDFKASLESWGLTDRVEIHEGSSLDLEDQGFCEEGRRFRLFSVDGGHLHYHVANDLRLAEKTLAEGGVVAADDFVNQHYLGVITGIFEYLDGGGTLVPYALIPNKLLLTDAASVERNRAQLRELFGEGLTKAEVPFRDVTIDVYGDPRWVVQDLDGNTAELQRNPNTVPELQRLVSQLRRERNRVGAQRTRLRRRVSELEAALHPTGRADVLPKALRAPARAVYRALRRR